MSDQDINKADAYLISLLPDIYTLLDSRLAAVQSIADTALDFLMVINTEQKKPEQVDQIHKTKFKKVNNLTDSIGLYYDISRLNLAEFHLETLILECRNVKIHLLENSETFKINAMDSMKKLNAKYSTYQKEVDTTNLTLISSAVKLISRHVLGLPDNESKIAQINELRAEFRKNTHVIYVYASLMQKLIDESYSSNKTLAMKLLEYISHDKSNILDLGNKIKQSGQNPPAYRFGLLPQTRSMPVADLMKIVLPALAVKNSSIPKIAKEIKHGIVVFNKLVYTPIEYDIRNLVVEDEAKQYMQEKDAGITSKTVERFKTIIEHKSDRWDFSTVVHNEEAEQFLVLDTLDGHNYRCLAPWVSSKSYLVSRHKISSILNLDPTKESTASNYHELQTRIATKNMFLSKALSIEDLEDQSTDVESNALRQVIEDKLIALVHVIYMKEYASAANNTTISKIVHDTRIEEFFITQVIKLYPSAVTDPFSGGRFPFREILASFITDLQTASRRLTRELHNIYSRNPLDNETFSLPKTERQEKIKEYLASVVSSAISLVISLDTNLYTSAYFKYLLLNYT